MSVPWLGNLSVVCLPWEKRKAELTRLSLEHLTRCSSSNWTSAILEVVCNQKILELQKSNIEKTLLPFIYYSHKFWSWHRAMRKSHMSCAVHKYANIALIPIDIPYGGRGADIFKIDKFFLHETKCDLRGDWTIVLFIMRWSGCRPADNVVLHHISIESVYWNGLTEEILSPQVTNWFTKDSPLSSILLKFGKQYDCGGSEA